MTSGDNDEFKNKLQKVGDMALAYMVEMEEMMSKPGKPMPNMDNVFELIKPYRAKFETAIASEVTQPLLDAGYPQALIDKFITEVPEIMFG
jgi:hypothetical protein